jgi:hypothetical protein
VRTTAAAASVRSPENPAAHPTFNVSMGFVP